jgi:hypothetical protein
MDQVPANPCFQCGVLWHFMPLVPHLIDPAHMHELGWGVCLTSKWTVTPVRLSRINFTHRSLIRHSCIHRHAQAVRRAPHPPSSPVQDMGVDHRGRHPGAPGAPAPSGCRTRPRANGSRRSAAGYDSSPASRSRSPAPPPLWLAGRPTHGGGAAGPGHSPDPGNSAEPGIPAVGASWIATIAGGAARKETRQ